MKKNRTALRVALLCSSAAVLFASTINTSTTTNGIQFSGFNNGPEKETDLTGSVANVGGDVCTFITVSQNSTCTGVNFLITLTPPNSETGSATWTLTNTGSVNITSLTLNLQPSNSVFHPCGTPGAIVQGNCAHQGGSVSSVSAGSTITGNVLYSNLATDLLSSSGHPFSPLYGQVTFSWLEACASPCTHFASGLNFAFSADTDFLAPVVPEPATLGLVGFALIGLGALRLRYRRKG